MLKFLLFCGLIAGAAVGGAWWADAQHAAPLAADKQSQQNPPGSRPAQQAPARYIVAVTPEEVPEGVVYHVSPTRAGRLAIGDDLDVAFDQAVMLGLPGQDSIRYQFLCHPLSVIARAKNTWDLESWRPDVGQVRTMLAGCDPA